MQQYIIFNVGQIKLVNNNWKYEANTKYRISEEDNQYYYIGKDKFSKSNKDYKVGEIIKDKWRD